MNLKVFQTKSTISKSISKPTSHPNLNNPPKTLSQSHPSPTFPQATLPIPSQGQNIEQKSITALKILNVLHFIAKERGKHSVCCTITILFHY
jgi:hypothetical protein